MNLRLFFLVCIFVKVFASESLSPINQPLQKHMFLDKTLSLMESIKDPVAFAEVFATADAATVQKVLVLMEQLANASLVSKQLLVSADVTAEKEVNNTKKNHEEAVKAEDAAKSLYDTAVTIKTQTATSLTEQGPGLDSEHKTIIKVIELLKSLVPNATESPTEAATQDGAFFDVTATKEVYEANGWTIHASTWGPKSTVNGDYLDWQGNLNYVTLSCQSNPCTGIMTYMYWSGGYNGFWPKILPAGSSEDQMKKTDTRLPVDRTNVWITIDFTYNDGDIFSMYTNYGHGIQIKALFNANE